jgi:hypothetical protein
MTGDTSALVIQFVFLAAIILAPWFYKRSKSLGLFVAPRSKEEVTKTHASLRQVKSKRVGEF